MQFDKDMASRHKGLFLETRQFLLDNYNLIETRKDHITTYADRFGGICHMRTMKHGIDIGFLKGASMDDKLGCLTGKGKKMRVLPMDRFDSEILKYFLDQAIEINASLSAQ